MLKPYYCSHSTVKEGSMYSFRKYVFIAIVLYSPVLFSQTSAFYSLQVPHSVTATAFGDQGVASMNPFDAIQYNPANLAYVSSIEFSFFKNPWKIIGLDMPLINLALISSYEKFGTLGISYSYHNYGLVDVPIAVPSDFLVLFFPTNSYHAYERSLSLSYATHLSEQVALGAQLLYAWRKYPLFNGENHIDKLMVGIGLSFVPASLNNRLNVGLSFMNFGQRVEYENGENDPVPAFMALGVQAKPVETNFYDIAASLSVSKPFDKRDGPPSYDTHSSFKLLFTDWDDFPEDATIHIGSGILWKPILLGAGLSFFQEMYFGYYSTGPKSWYDCFYTHGAKVGVCIYGVKIGAGYGGKWFNKNEGSSIDHEYPWETFQIDLSTTLFHNSPVIYEKPKNIVLSTGYSYGIPIGRMKKTEFQVEPPFEPPYLTFSMKSIWSLEAAFYLDDRFALLTSGSYSRMKAKLVMESLTFDSPIETGTFASGFRYHFLEPLFFQASVGILWLNPTNPAVPRYSYWSFDELMLGCALPVSHLTLTPRIGLRTMLMKVAESRVGGYNLIEAGVSVGYEF